MRRTFFGIGIAPLLGGLLATLIVPAAAATLIVASENLTVFATTSIEVPTKTCAITASDPTELDTYIDENDPKNFFGAATSLVVRSWNQGKNRNARTLIEFDLSSCEDFANAAIQTAGLQLYLSSAPSASRTYGAHRINGAWNETTKWEDNTLFIAAASDSETTPSAGSTMTWDGLASDVQGFVDGTFTNEGWMIKDASENSADARQGSFTSSEGTAAQRPVLTITYYP